MKIKTHSVRDGQIRSKASSASAAVRTGGCKEGELVAGYSQPISRHGLDVVTNGDTAHKNAHATSRHRLLTSLLGRDC